MRHLTVGQPDLKTMPPGADLAPMAKDLCCPICNADVPLAGDESLGDEVFCTYCGAPCKVVGGDAPETFDLEEDF
jgi:hypothetical protein